MSSKFNIETRKTTKIRFIEKNPEKIKSYVLPTYEDVLRHYEWVRHQMKEENQLEPQAKLITSEVGRAVIEVWKTATIPTVSETRVSQPIMAYCNQYRQLLKNYNREPKSQSYLDKIQNFKDKSTVLFDIAACKCKDFTSCKCGKFKTIPVKERPFIDDQRTLRRMMIGTVDKKTTEKFNKTLQRRQKEQKSKDLPNPPRSPQPSTSGTAFVRSSDSENTTSSDDDVGDDTQQHYTTRKSRKRKLPELNLGKLAETCDRYGLSYRAGTAVASAALSDFREKDSPVTPIIIDHNKLKRARVKQRRILLQNQSKQPLRALYFDGRKDQTLYYIRLNKKLYRRIRVEEHVTIIQEPGAEYVGHITPKSGTSSSIEEAMFSYLNERKISLNSLIVVGCDGTNVNTGWKNGVIVRLEKRLSKPLQWFICLLHANELPLRHLIEHLDGLTTGPKSFSGPIGKKLATCENRPITSFEVIPVELSDLTNVQLSTDQQYLYDFCRAVSTGVVNPDLAKRNPGKMSHARWLTTANRTLRLYVSTEKPSNELVLLAKYISKTYGPTWFQIKINSSCKDGARNLWFLIANSRFLPEDIKAIIDPVIQRNAYYAHPENLFLSMLTDEDKTIRELGCRRILKARSSAQATKMRPFVIPKIIFDCDNYYGMIDWHDEKLRLTEPPLLRSLETSELEAIVQEGNVELSDFPKFPCHTQSVERGVKLTTEASIRVAGNKAREGFIAARLKSRKIMPRFNSKQDFK